MQFRQPVGINQKSKLYRALSARGVSEAVLRGRVLVLDPSCGSSSSKPGYAIYFEGALVDSGVIDMPIEESLAYRLYYLGRCLRDQFREEFDVVVVEDVPSHRFSKGRGGRKYASFGQQLSLHYACGVAMASFAVEHVLRITPQTWWMFAPADYEKSDESDAIVMGHAIVEVSMHVIGGRGLRRTRAKKKSKSKRG